MSLITLQLLQSHKVRRGRGGGRLGGRAQDELNLKLQAGTKNKQATHEGQIQIQVLTEHFPTRLYFRPFSDTA